jgi:histidine ammonia-lyase
MPFACVATACYHLLDCCQEEQNVSAMTRTSGRILVAITAMLLSVSSRSAEIYQPINPMMAEKTIALTGQDLSVDELVQIARYGAKVAIGQQLRDGAADSFGLILEAQAENVPVYLFNRNAGSGREVVSLRGSPDSPEYKAELDRRYNGVERAFRATGFGEEIPDEEVGRAMLVVDLNNMRYLAASPAYVQGIADLLNHGVTPPVLWHGAIGEADFVPTGTVLQGYGYAYYKGVRMRASEALEKAGLKPIRFDGADGNLVTTSALTGGLAGLLVHDLRELIEWHDLIWTMDLTAMNGSIGPLTMPVQATRPFAWANYAAERALDMLKGSYVFNGESRIIQDPESLRATVWRDGGVWAAWARLRDSTLIQMNSTDHNPTIRPDIAPSDSWELSTPQLMKYYVKGGKYSHGKHGYVLSNSDWDPYPLVDDVEAFPVALVNLMVAVVQRMHRFEDTFFTVTDAEAVLKMHAGPGGPSGAGGGGGGGAMIDALWQELKPLANPIPPDGVTADKGVGDLDAVPVVKLMRLKQAMIVSREILAQDLLNAAFWMDIRKLEKPERTFGSAPGTVWTNYRKVVPFRSGSGKSTADESVEDTTLHFLETNSPQTFYEARAIAMPGGNEPRPPMAQPRRTAAN